MALPTSSQQRDAIVAIAPPWLQNESPPLNGAPMGVGGRFLYNIGLADDALLEKLNQAMRGHMPTLCDASCLPFIGNDRVLTQGPVETTESFRLRLQNAFASWQLAGERQTVMEQVAIYMDNLLQTAPADAPLLATVGGYKAEQWSMYYVGDDTSDPPALIRLGTQNFSWDGLESTLWWRNWLVFYNNLTPLGISGTSATVNSASGGFAVITGLSGASGDTATDYNSYLTVSGAAHAGNNGTFQIVSVVSGTEVEIANPLGVYPDANSGSLTWSISKFPNLAPAPVWGAPGQVWGGNTNQCYGLQQVGAANSFNLSVVLQGLRNLVRLWKSAQTFYPAFIFTWFGGNGTAGFEFSPYSTESTGNPDGTWGSNYTNGTYPPNSTPALVRSRSTGRNSQLSNMVCVTDGTAVYQQCTEPTGT